MIPLAWTHDGEPCVVQNLQANDRVGRRLAELGFAAGEPVTVQNRLGNNLIVAIRDTRVAIDEQLALHILVRPLMAEEPRKTAAKKIPGSSALCQATLNRG